MDMRKRLENLQLGAGLLTWALVTGLAVWMVVSNELDQYSIPLMLALALANLASMLIVASQSENVTLVQKRLAHAVQVVSVLTLGWLVPFGFLPIYTIIWIAMGSSLYSERTQWIHLIGVTFAWYVIMQFSWQDVSGFFSASLYGTFHLFAVLTARVAHSAETARERAEFLNSELLATQHLLSEASRQSERTRIARDLHDLLGHHLTALSINLQIAERLADGEAKDKIAESRALARLLLSDVRDAVSTLREESEVDFAQAVRLLVERVPQLDVNLDIEEGLAIDEFEIAESLLRCIQEALTNTLRHSGASRSWIRLWREDGDVHLEIHDNGKQKGELVEGNGFAGMRERLARLKGRLNVETIDHALRLHVTIPESA